MPRVRIIASVRRLQTLPWLIRQTPREAGMAAVLLILANGVLLAAAWGRMDASDVVVASTLLDFAVFFWLFRKISIAYVERMMASCAAMMDAVVTAAPDRSIVLFNPAAEAMFGYAARDVLGKPVDMLIPEPAYPITWDEQDRLFPKLPPHLQRMALFAVNTGLRDGNVCGLEWAWEVPVPEIGRSVFVIPSDSYKSNRDHVVILNDAAWSIVQSQRGLHPRWVFPYRGRRVNKMNNTAWQKARAQVGLRYVRIHDLRHTFACRLRAAGVSDEDRCTLLGHATHTMSGHYASGDLGRLLKEANLVLNRQETRTVLRVVAGRFMSPGALTSIQSKKRSQPTPQLARLGMAG